MFTPQTHKLPLSLTFQAGEGEGPDSFFLLS